MIRDARHFLGPKEQELLAAAAEASWGRACCNTADRVCIMLKPSQVCFKLSKSNNIKKLPLLWDKDDKDN